MITSSANRRSLRSRFAAVIAILTLLAFAPAESPAQNLDWRRLNGPYGGNILDLLSDSSDNLFAFSGNELDKFDPVTNSWTQLIAGHAFDNRASAVIIRNRTDIAISHGSEWLETYDGGKTWGRTGGGVMTDIITPGFEIGDTVYAGTASHGVVRTISSTYLSYWAQVDTSHWPVYSLIRDQSNAIVAGSLGAVYKSTDQGNTWSTLTSGLPAVNVSALKEFNGTLIAGTNGNGVFEWNPGTSRWAPLNQGVEPWIISSLATRNGSLFVSSLDAGIFRYDGGTSWTQFNSALPIASVSKLFVRANGDFLAGTTDGLYSLDPNNTWKPIGLPVTQLISLVESPNHALLARCNNGLFRSTDSGERWTDISINSTRTSVTSITQSADGMLIAAVGLNVFRSKDGKHWTQSTIGGSGGPNSIVYSVGGPNLYIFNDYLYRSSNDGASWQLQNNLAQIRPAQFSGKDDLIFGANSVALYRSRDSGAHWDSVFHRGTVIASGRRVRIVNVYESGRYNSYYSSDAGDSWQLVPSTDQYQIYAGAIGSGGVYFAANGGVLHTTDLSAPYTTTGLINYSTAVATNGPTVVAFEAKGGVFYSTDTGGTWHPSQGVYDSVLSLSSDVRGRYFAATVGGVYRSEDSGKTFSASSIGLEPTALNFSNPPNASGLAVARDGRVFANAIGGGLDVSTDDGDHWRMIDTTGFLFSGQPFAIAPTGRIFRTASRSYYLTYSDDEGANWDTVNQLLLGAFAFDSVGGVIAFNSTSGNKDVHYSSDNGINWQEFDGLHSYGIPCFAAVDPSGQIYLCNLFFGTGSDQHSVITTRNFVDTVQHPVLDTVSITAIAIDRDGHAYAAASNLQRTDSYALYASTDRGATWTNVRSSTFPSQSIRTLLPTDQYIYAGTDGGGLMRARRPAAARSVADNPTRMIPPTLFPSPANFETTIRSASPEPRTIRIVNSLGECVAQYSNVDSDLHIDTRQLTSAVYSVVATSMQGTSISRLVVEH